MCKVCYFFAWIIYSNSETIGFSEHFFNIKCPHYTVFQSKSIFINVTSILLSIGTKFCNYYSQSEDVGSSPGHCKGISDSTNDFILIVFFGFNSKKYINSENPR